MRTTVRELSELVGGELHGNGDCEITGVSSIEEAMPGDVVFAQDARYLRIAAGSAASAIIGPVGARNTGKPLILVDDPKYAFARILELFAPRQQVEPGVHPSAYVGSDSRLGQDVSVQFCAYVGENVTVGDRCRIYPHSYIADNVTLGADCVIHPFVAIHQGVIIGDRVTIHSGSVIGSDGFGYVMVEGIGHTKIPQIGNVVIGDDVEIGANSAIDRARTGSTEIGAGTKIDNLAHIAHNVKIGKDCLVVALVGVAGTVTLGDGVVLAGQAGVKDHVNIGDGVVVAARAGVIGDLPAGARVSGFPARDHCEQMRATAALQRLPELMKALGRLEDRIAALEGHKTEDESKGQESGG